MLRCDSFRTHTSFAKLVERVDVTAEARAMGYHRLVLARRRKAGYASVLKDVQPAAVSDAIWLCCVLVTLSGP